MEGEKQNTPRSRAGTPRSRPGTPRATSMKSPRAPLLISRSDFFCEALEQEALYHSSEQNSSAQVASITSGQNVTDVVGLDGVGADARSRTRAAVHRQRAEQLAELLKLLQEIKLVRGELDSGRGDQQATLDSLLDRLTESRQQELAEVLTDDFEDVAHAQERVLELEEELEHVDRLLEGLREMLLISSALALDDDFAISGGGTTASSSSLTAAAAARQQLSAFVGGNAAAAAAAAAASGSSNTGAATATGKTSTAAAAASKAEGSTEVSDEQLLELASRLVSRHALLQERYLSEARQRRALHNELVDLKGAIRVLCRVRPPLPEEAVAAAEAAAGPFGSAVAGGGGGGSGLALEVESSSGVVTVLESKTNYGGDCTPRVKRSRFQYDGVFGPSSTQEQVWAEAAPVVTSVLDGYNVCIFAYGQTGSGKTYTMDGPPGSRGVNYRTLSELFQLVSERRLESKYCIAVSLLEVYCDTVIDLLVQPPSSSASASSSSLASSSTTSLAGAFSSSSSLVGGQGKGGAGGVDAAGGVGFGGSGGLEVKAGPFGTYLPGLTEQEVHSTHEAFKVLEAGMARRSSASTTMNDVSSRSHCMLVVKVRGESRATGETWRSKLWLVDLAGSERLSRTEATGGRLREAQFINKSLSALGDCIHALATKSTHVPFRNSKLTYILQDSLSGDSKTLMFVNVSPMESDTQETLCSLNFASRVRGLQLGPAKKQQQQQQADEATSTELAEAKQAAKSMAEKLSASEEEARLLRGRLQAAEAQVATLKHQQAAERRQAQVAAVNSVQQQQQQLGQGQGSGGTNISKNIPSITISMAASSINIGSSNSSSSSSSSNNINSSISAENIAAAAVNGEGAAAGAAVATTVAAQTPSSPSPSPPDAVPAPAATPAPAAAPAMALPPAMPAAASAAPAAAAPAVASSSALPAAAPAAPAPAAATPVAAVLTGAAKPLPVSPVSAAVSPVAAAVRAFEAAAASPRPPSKLAGGAMPRPPSKRAIGVVPRASTKLAGGVAPKQLPHIKVMAAAAAPAATTQRTASMPAAVPAVPSSSVTNAAPAPAPTLQLPKPCSAPSTPRGSHNNVDTFTNAHGNGSGSVEAPIHRLSCRTGTPRADATATNSSKRPSACGNSPPNTVTANSNASSSRSPGLWVDRDVSSELQQDALIRRVARASEAALPKHARRRSVSAPPRRVSVFERLYGLSSAAKTGGGEGGAVGDQQQLGGQRRAVTPTRQRVSDRTFGGGSSSSTLQRGGSTPNVPSRRTTPAAGNSGGAPVSRRQWGAGSPATSSSSSRAKTNAAGTAVPRGSVKAAAAHGSGAAGAGSADGSSSSAGKSTSGVNIMARAGAPPSLFTDL